MSEDFDELLCNDPRYKLGAYEFVMESLGFAQRAINSYEQRSGENIAENEDEPPAEAIRHISGPHLCNMMRLYALQQYGYLALPVLKSWGIKATSDFGQIVYNLVKAGKLITSPNDKIEDFDNVYDFSKAFTDDFDFK